MASSDASNAHPNEMTHVITPDDVSRVFGLGARVPRRLPQQALGDLLTIVPPGMLRDVLIAWQGRVDQPQSAMSQSFHPEVSFNAGNALSQSLKKIRGMADSRRLRDLVAQLDDWLARFPKTVQMGPSETHDLMCLRDDLLVAIGATNPDGNALPPVKFVKTPNQGVEARSLSAAQKKARKGRGRESGKVKGPRKTQRAVLETVRDDSRVELSVSDVVQTLDVPRHGYAVVEKLVAWIAKLCGRVDTWFHAWVSAKALIMGKVGLVYDHLAEGGVLEDLATKPHTMAFLVMAITEFGARNA